MKKYMVVLLSLLCFYSLVFASDVMDLLDKAKIEYSNGNLSETINLIDSAKNLLKKKISTLLLMNILKSQIGMW